MDGQRLQPNEPRASLGWNREAVTFRLTPKRKGDLLAVRGDDANASPTEALDLAIDIALSCRGREEQDANALGGEEVASQLEALRHETRSLSASVESWAGANELLARVAADCAELRHAIASASLLADGLRVADDGASAPIKSLLDKLGDATAWAAFKAHWVGKRPSGPGLACWNVELRELRGAHEERGLVSSATLGPDWADGPMAGLETRPECVLTCSRSESGWALELRPVLAQGKLGAPFAQWRL